MQISNIEIKVVEADQSHIDALKGNLRDVDIKECEMLGEGYSPDELFQMSYDLATYAFAGLWNGECFCVMGLNPNYILSDRALPWMVGDDRLYSRVAMKAFLYFADKILNDWICIYPYLHNWIYAGNKKTIKWLKRVGFTVEPAIDDISHFYKRGRA